MISTIESGRAPTQQNLGLVIGGSSLRPLCLPRELRIGSTRVEVLAERIAERHLTDTGEAYYRMPIQRRGQMHREWIKIAGLNPEYTAKITGIQKAMKESRRLRDSYFEDQDARDVLEDAFNFSLSLYVENEGTRTVLEDILRVNAWEHFNSLVAEQDLEDELGLAFPDLALEQDGIYELPGITPANIFQKILEGKITLAGSGIETTVSDDGDAV